MRERGVMLITRKHFEIPDLNRRTFIHDVGTVSLGLSAAAWPGRLAAAQVDTTKSALDPDGPLRIGLIGTSGHYPLVLNELKSVAHADIAAWAFEDADWTFNSDGSRRDGRTYDIESRRRWVHSQPSCDSNPLVYETYQEMFDREQLDLAVVCLPYARNAYAIAAAAEAGAHILSEKPMAVSQADLEMVQQAVKRSGVRLSAMFEMRYTASGFTVRQSVARGEIGIPCHGLAQKSYKWGASRPWFYRHPEIYGSTILWAGIHAVDLVRWTMGLEVTEVSAMHGNIAHPDYAGAQDHAVISLRFENGASAAVTVDYLRPPGAATHADNRLRIAGSGGVVEKSGDGTVTLCRGDEPAGLVNVAQPPSLFADFVAELRGQGTHLIGPDEAVRVTRICIAATEAARSGRVIHL